MVNDATRAEMKQMLKRNADGTYAKKWISENRTTPPWLNSTREREQEQLLEKVGAKLRAMMPFLNPVNVTPQSEQAAVASK